MSLLSFAYKPERIEIIGRHLHSFLKLVLQFGRCSELQSGVIRAEVSINDGDTLNRREGLLEERIVIRDTAPALTVKAIRDVKLSLGITAFRIRTFKRVA